MAKQLLTGAGSRNNPERKIDLGPLRFTIDKYRQEDVPFVLYKLSYAGKFIFIKGKSLAGSLIILADTLGSFNPDSPRFKDHLYTHLYQHLLDSDPGRFRVHIIKSATDDDFYGLLKEEQSMLDMHRYNPCCLNNQIEAYIPQFSEKTNSYGWLPRAAVMNFKQWLDSAERKAQLKQYKK